MQLLQHFKELTLRPKNAQELKGLILQLAIQGKLTANWRLENPNVEEASESLERIKKEKKQFIKGKRIKKEKLLPEINKNEIPFELPNSWRWCRLNDLGIIGSSSRVHQKDWQTDGVPFYRAREIVKLSRFGHVDNNLFITEELFEKFKENGSVPENNDIMITGVGTIGIPYVVNEQDRFYFKDASVLIFKNIFNLFSEYLNLFFSSQYWMTEIHKDSMGTTVHTLTISRAKIVPAIFPPLEEQKEIVKVVETLFKEVEQLEQLTVARIGLKEDFVTSALNQLTTKNAKQEWLFLQEHFKSFFNETTNIKKLRETVLQLAVQGKLTKDWRVNNLDTEDASVLLKRIQEEKAQLIKEKKIKKEKPLPPITKEEIQYELPEGWVWCRMGTVSDIQRGSSPRPKGDPLYFSEEKTKNHWISIKDISKHAKNNILLDTEEYLTDLGTQFSRYVNKNELIVAVSGSTTGKCCLTGIDGYFYDGLAMVRLIGSSINHQYHLMYYLQLYNHMNDAKFGAAFPNINTKFLSEMMFPFPPLEEQKAIVQKVNALMGLCDRLEQEVQQSQEHSEQLMQSCLREVFEENKNLVDV